jgi:hypothetical protein
VRVNYYELSSLGCLSQKKFGKYFYHKWKVYGSWDVAPNLKYKWSIYNSDFQHILFLFRYNFRAGSSVNSTSCMHGNKITHILSNFWIIQMQGKDLILYLLAWQGHVLTLLVVHPITVHYTGPILTANKFFFVFAFACITWGQHINDCWCINSSNL